MLTAMSDDSTILRHWLYLVLCGCEVSHVRGAAYVWREGWVAACAWACGFVSTAARHPVGSQMAHNGREFMQGAT